MAIYSPLRYRRLTNSQTEQISQIIGFRLGAEWFGLAIDAIYKIIVMGQVYGDPKATGVSLTNYEGQELLVVDVARQIFGEAAPFNFASLETSEQRFLAILQHQNGNFLGLPIDSPPSVFRVPQSAFTSLPESYLEQGNIQCISSTMVQMSDRQPLFLLDANLLFQRSYSKPSVG